MTTYNPCLSSTPIHSPTLGSPQLRSRNIDVQNTLYSTTELMSWLTSIPTASRRIRLHCNTPISPWGNDFSYRLVAFNAYHDTGENGVSLENQRRLIELLKPHGRILITSEKPLTSEFEPYRLPVPPEEIHSLMAYSSLFLGDSQTMTSEAAVLGVPALKCNTFAGRLSVPNMLEQRYGLCYAYLPSQFDEMYHHIEQLLARNPDELKKEWQAKRKRMLNEMIDPTEFFVNFIEHYESLS